MLETLRKKAKKSNIWRIALSVVGIVILLAITKFAIFDVITGPAHMDITEDPSSYEGKYVTIDADFFLYDYIEHTTTTKKPTKLKNNQKQKQPQDHNKKHENTKKRQIQDRNNKKHKRRKVEYNEY